MITEKQADWPTDLNWVFCDDFTQLNYNGPAFRGIDGFTIDIENVLTDGIASGDPTVRPEAMATLSTMHNIGKRFILATNCVDTEFVQDVTDQINVNRPAEDPIRALTKTLAGHGKINPKMFRIASGALSVPVRRMGHIDDQLKAHLGAWRAHYGMHISTLPWGEHQHPGVERARPFEVGVVRELFKYHANGRVTDYATS
ncbi:MAG: hypothetical protein QG553_466 [Patescibacteria group bacterium]|nr:hypothetical protein [Patescibacteria group bacterium]